MATESGPIHVVHEAMHSDDVIVGIAGLSYDGVAGGEVTVLQDPGPNGRCDCGKK